MGGNQPITGGVIGRSDQMAALQRALVHGEARVAEIHGAPGTGKTSLALAFAHQHAASFPGGTTLMIAESDFDLEPLGRGQAVTRPALLVIDDVDCAPLPAFVRELRELLDSQRQLRVLLTSAIRFTPFDRLAYVEMPPLAPEAIGELLRSRLWLPDEDVARIVARVAGNPEVATSVSRRVAGGQPLDRILAWLEPGITPTILGPDGRPLAPDAPERRQIDISVAEISEADPRARQRARAASPA